VRLTIPKSAKETLTRFVVNAGRFHTTTIKEESSPAAFGSQYEGGDGTVAYQFIPLECLPCGCYAFKLNYTDFSRR
jgi:hypothetical protein